jgi:type IV secretory pathway VirB10-like protein
MAIARIAGCSQEFLMFSKPVAFALLALGCLTAAAAGAYVATRHNVTDRVASVAQAPAATATSAEAPKPVAETEAAVAERPASEATPQAESDTPSAAPENRHATAEKAKPSHNEQPSSTRTTPLPEAHTGSPSAVTTAPVAQVPPPPQVQSAPVDLPKPPDPQPEPARAPQFEDVTLPTSSVIGLQVETAVSSERARIEDRVDARVTRDVVANGHVAIPAGSRVLGSVTLVDRGGKVKDRARLGIRFHTLVLADGSEVHLNTEPFYRDGESPSGDSAKKIGGAAAVGAILGGILGGGKGAVIGGTTGAAGGTAATMAGDRNPATLAPGSIVTVRLSSPVTIQVESREQ